jgi:hypothetical protein
LILKNRDSGIDGISDCGALENGKRLELNFSRLIRITSLIEHRNDPNDVVCKDMFKRFPRSVTVSARLGILDPFIKPMFGSLEARHGIT